VGIDGHQQILSWSGDGKHLLYLSNGVLRLTRPILAYGFTDLQSQGDLAYGQLEVKVTITV
jgi:hypothetical protein